VVEAATPVAVVVRMAEDPPAAAPAAEVLQLPPARPAAAAATTKFSGLLLNTLRAKGHPVISEWPYFLLDRLCPKQNIFDSTVAIESPYDAAIS